ncbi:CD9 antigen isoform X2 [Sebastes umbrosus]|uniref:CD9 antigen isoform X2 n=1 Tax=Sebastes umbrosus TaxID=72105 RepID=UPI00189E240A|nr:CD9 antigen isoform X2 [Sebastes umbrosus]
MALDGCGLVCKFILIIFNIVFAVLGFAFLGLGLWLRFSGSTRGIFEVGDLNSGGFVLVVTVLIVLGVVMLIVVAFGDYGACNEKRCSLQVFSVLLTILAVVLVAVGVLAYSRRDVVGSNFAEFYVSMYGLYLTNGGDPVIGVSLTFIHKTLHCCGLTGISLVELAKKTCPEPDGIFEHFKMDSCPGIILSVFDSKAPLVMGVFVGTGALLIIALVCTIILLQQTKRNQQEVTAYYSNVY